MPIHRAATSPVLRQFIDLFEARVASLSLAGSWDNVGLLVEPLNLRHNPQSVSDLSVFVTIDLTRTVLEEALQSNCNLILTYHPILFAPTQSLTPSSQAVAVAALASGVAVFSPHTALDSVSGGINDFFLTQVLGNSEDLSRRVPCLLEGETPVGRVAFLRESLALSDLIAKVKTLTGLSTVRYALPVGSENASEVFVNSVSFCAGAGGSVVKTTAADCVVTGELSHHEILAHTGAGRCVVLTEHSNCERPFLPRLAQLLLETVGVVKVFVSQRDRDPVRFA